MFDLTWKNKKAFCKEKNLDLSSYTQDSYIQLDNVKSVSNILWEEHCLECAPPHCYKQCEHYLCRVDKKCKRSKYGFIKNTSVKGLYSYGVDLRFETWGKIEAKFNPNHALTPKQSLSKQSKINSLYSFALYFSKLFSFLSPTLKPLGAVKHYSSIFNKLLSNSPVKWDEFVIEVYSPQDKDVQIRLQCDTKENILFTENITISPGYNFFHIPYQNFNIPSNTTQSFRIYLTPQINEKPRLVFTWLDFVKYKKSHTTTKPANKVKCIAWDLDNTLWNGILSEDGKDKISINQNAINTIKVLDERGIVSTIVSKNSHQLAWNVIESYNLQDYFVYPAINWGQKSENLKQISQAMNIGLDSFAFIDDSEYERKEVQQLGCVRVFKETEIDDLLSRDEFDVPITIMSKKRRISYLASMKRDTIRERFGEDYDAYLQSLNININIIPVKQPDVRKRCFELLQRSNQLNLSTRRYSQKEFDQLVTSPSMKCFAFSTSDTIGDLGIVGFVSFDLSQKPTLKICDLVISCRAAQKKIEQSVLCTFLTYFHNQNFNRIQAFYKKTAKNHPINMILDSLPFQNKKQNSEDILYYSDTLQDFDLKFPHTVSWKDEN